MAYRKFLLGVAPIAALALAACGDERMEQAGEDIRSAAENVAGVAQDAASEAGDAIRSGVDEAGQAIGEAADHAQHNIEQALDSGRTPSPDGARVWFANLEDGAVVTSPVTIQFGSEGFTVTEAGDQTPGTGHHHLLVDVTVDDLDLSYPIPTDDNHLHYGQAQTEATIELAPGEHTLQLVLGDWTHIPHDPVVASDVIKITVQ